MKADSEPLVLYCCRTGNILQCRRRVAAWKIPGEILLLLLAQDESQLQYFAEFGAVTLEEEEEKLRKVILGERSRSSQELEYTVCKSAVKKLLVLSPAKKNSQECVFAPSVMLHQCC